MCRKDSSRWVSLLLSAPLVDVSSLSNQKIVKRPYPITHFPGHFKFVHKFPVGKSTMFLYPSNKDIQTKPPLRSGLFMLGAICNRWKIVARPGLEPRAFLSIYLPIMSNPCWGPRHRSIGLSLTVQTLYHWATWSSQQQLFTWTLPGYNLSFGLMWGFLEEILYKKVCIKQLTIAKSYDTC